MARSLSVLDAAVRVALVTLLFAVFLFVPAGTLDWPAAWGFLAVYVAFAFVVVGWLRAHNPRLLAERLDFNVRKREGKPWDVAVRFALAMVFVLTTTVTAFDAVRDHWTSVPLAVQLACFVLVALGWAFIFWVMQTNTSLWRVVDVKKGQTVITTGPYAIVRHPMYLGSLLTYAAMPVALGSYAGLAPVSIMFVVLMYRTAREDATLHAELPGYRQYAQKTRYKLVPGVW